MSDPTALDFTGDTLAEQGLFEMDAKPSISLSDRFLVPPFSILDRRGGTWQSRRRLWLQLGIESEVGRAEGMVYGSSFTDRMGDIYGESSWQATQIGTSIFDPVLCELAYRWFSAPDWLVLDPFAGGSVRGIVASILQRRYMGVELRAEQVAANQAQGGLGADSHPPLWLHGDSREVVPALDPESVDLVFTCPPYADLEVYSDLEADLSTMSYPEFLRAQQAVIVAAAAALKPNRFFVWVTSDVRAQELDGRPYRGLVADTIGQCQNAGIDLYNDLLLLDPVGTGAVRAANLFSKTRKVVRLHQHALVFVKGSAKAATVAMGEAATVAVGQDVAQSLAGT